MASACLLMIITGLGSNLPLWDIIHFKAMVMCTMSGVFNILAFHTTHWCYHPTAPSAFLLLARKPTISHWLQKIQNCKGRSLTAIHSSSTLDAACLSCGPQPLQVLRTKQTVLHMGRDNPKHKCRLNGDWIEST